MATRTPKRGQSARRMTDGAPPVVEDAKLPRMGEGEVAPSRIGGRIALMTEEPKRDEGTRNRMAPFRHVKNPADTRMPKGGYPEQQPPKPPRRGKPAARAAKPAQEGYVRLRVLVQDGELAVMGAKFVEGPLAPMEMLQPGLAYEVTLGTRRIAAGAIVEGDPGLPTPTLDAAPGTATYREVRPEDIRVTVEATAPSIVVVRNAWDRGWSATVDGRPAPVLRADYLLQGIPVTEGRHEIRLTYREPSIGRGLLLSALVWLGWLVALGVLWWRERRTTRSLRPAA